MTLWIALLLTGQSFATATVEARVELRADADNRPSIQSLLDSAAEGSVVRIPAGTWNVNTAPVIRRKLTFEGPATGTATLRLIANNAADDVLRVGDYHGNLKANNVTIRRLTLEVAGLTKTGVYNCLDTFGDDLLVEDVILKNSPHEGCAGAGKRAMFNRVTAINCGNGNETYSLSTAGLNCHSHPTIYTDCETDGCPQGAEVDGHGSKVLRCKFRNPPPGITPQMGVNIGSTGMGINDVEVAECEIVGFDTGVGFGNGIGRLANVHIHDNLIDDGSVGGSGGRRENLAHDPDYPPGPDTGNTIIERNTFIVRHQHNGICGLSTGPNPDDELTREPVSFLDNDFYFLVQVNDTPSMAIGGRWNGPVTMKLNKFFGQNAAPSRGDIATFSMSNSPALKGQPNLFMEGNAAFTSDGKQRPVIAKVEGK